MLTISKQMQPHSHSNYNIECTTTHSNSLKKTKKNCNWQGQKHKKKTTWLASKTKANTTVTTCKPTLLHCHCPEQRTQLLFFLKHHISKFSTGNVQSDLSISQKCKSRASTQRLQKTLAKPSCEEALHVWALNVRERWVGPKTLIMMSALFLIALQPNVCVNKDQRKRWKTMSHNDLIT